MSRLEFIETRVEKANIFELFSYLKELAVLENDEKFLLSNEVMVEGLIERVQEQIIFSKVS